MMTMEKASEIVKEMPDTPNKLELFDHFYGLFRPINKSAKDMTDEELERDAKFGYMFASMCGFLTAYGIQLVD